MPMLRILGTAALLTMGVNCPFWHRLRYRNRVHAHSISPVVMYRMRADLNLGMPFSTKCSVQITPQCNGPVQLSVITLGVTADVASGKATGGVQR